MTTVDEKKRCAFLNYRRGLCSYDDYEYALLQIDLKEVGVICPWCLIKDVKHYWLAFCENPKACPELTKAVNAWIWMKLNV